MAANQSSQKKYLRTAREGDAPAGNPGSGVISGDGSSLTNNGSPELTPDPLRSPTAAAATPAKNLENPNLLPNRLPRTPMTQEIGNLIPEVDGRHNANHGASAVTEIPPAVALTSSNVLVGDCHNTPPDARLSCREASPVGNQSPGNRDAADPLTELLHRALVATKTRRDCPTALDDQAEGHRNPPRVG